jgi:crotonyl-CoA carboxylase/reductase
MCETGGMVVICAGTTGYNATPDLRYHWVRQKRLQGSHSANDDQARGVTELVAVRDNQHPSGNMAILVNAPRPGLRTLADVRAAR